MSKGWIAGILRVRQVQEDAARHHQAEAEFAATRARIRARNESERLAGLTAEQDDGTSSAFVAAAVALQAAAATHSAAVQAVSAADYEVDERRARLGVAARARRSVENLHEQHRAAEQAAAQAAEPRDLDEVAARLHRSAPDA